MNFLDYLGALDEAPWMAFHHVPMKGMLDQDKENPSNQEIKAVSLLFKELRPVGEAVVQARMDPGKGHFCWLMT